MQLHSLKMQYNSEMKVNGRDRQTSVLFKQCPPPPLPSPPLPPVWGQDLRDRFSKTNIPQHQTPTECAQTPSPAAGGLWAAAHHPPNSYCLSSALLKLHFTKQDAAAWEIEKSRFVYQKKKHILKGKQNTHQTSDPEQLIFLIFHLKKKKKKLHSTWSWFC